MTVPFAAPEGAAMPPSQQSPGTLIAVIVSPESSMSDRARAVRLIKNSVIGNGTRKREFHNLKVLSVMVGILNGDLPAELKAEAAAIIGSLSMSSSPAIKESLASEEILMALCRNMTCTDTLLSQSCTRCVKILVRGSREAGGAYSGGVVTYSAEIVKKAGLDKHVERLLVSNVSSRQTEFAASIIAGITAPSNTIERPQLNTPSLLGPLITYINPSTTPHQLQETAFDALASLCHGDATACREIFRTGEKGVENRVMEHTLAALRCLDRPMKRLNAAAFLTNCHRTVPLEPPHAHVMGSAVLPALIRFIGDKNAERAVVWRALEIFSDLVGVGEEMQKAAMEGCAVAVLKGFVLVDGKDGEKAAGKEKEKDKGAEIVPFVDVTVKSVWVERLKEAALVALASVCSNSEPTRKHVIDSNLLPVTVATLSSPKTSLRAAACLLIRSISRSVKTLRSSLVDAGVATPLLSCLSDTTSPSLQLSASAALCNLVLDFSPMKAQVLDSGGLDSFVSLLSSTHPGLRLNAIWAIKNLLFHADNTTKRRVMASLTYPRLMHLISAEQDSNLIEQTLNLLRNLVCGSKVDVEDALQGLGSQELLGVLARHLAGESEAVVLQALYVVVNISTADAVVRDAVMNSELIAAIKRFLSSKRASVRLAAVWCVINLSEGDVEGAENRVKALREIGIEQTLRSLSEDTDTDVRGRVRSAIVAFSGSAAIASSASEDSEMAESDGPMF